MVVDGAESESPSNADCAFCWNCCSALVGASTGGAKSSANADAGAPATARRARKAAALVTVVSCGFAAGVGAWRGDGQAVMTVPLPRVQRMDLRGLPRRRRKRRDGAS